MLALFRQIFQHEAWADALHWQALRQTPSALERADVQSRLNHIHQVQRGFLGLLKGGGFARPEPIPDMDALQASMQTYHDDILTWLASATLEGTIQVPWVKGLEVTVPEALTQLSQHGQYHRAQNALRLKEAGAQVPVIDFIKWVMDGRPSPSWPT